ASAIRWSSPWRRPSLFLPGRGRRDEFRQLFQDPALYEPFPVALDELVLVAARRGDVGLARRAADGDPVRRVVRRIRTGERDDRVGHDVKQPRGRIALTRRRPRRARGVAVGDEAGDLGAAGEDVVVELEHAVLGE